MNWIHKHRRVFSAFALAVFLLGSASQTAQAYYNPKTGKFMQRDPNGTAILVTNALRESARNPTVTVNMAYELQYGDGMNFYEYMKSNPGNGNDPSGLYSMWGAFKNVVGKYGPGSLYVPALIDVALIGGYTSGVLWADKFGGWGPRTFAQKAAMIWDKVGYVQPTKLVGLASWFAFSFGSSTAELIGRSRGQKILPRWLRKTVVTARKINRAASSIPLSIAAPLLAAGDLPPFYVPVAMRV